MPDDFGRRWYGKTLPDNLGNGYQPAGTNVGNMSNTTSDYKAQAYKLGTLSGKEEDKQYNNYDPLYKNLSGFDDDKVINYNNERPFVERDNNENILINECSQSPRFVRYMKRLKQPDREGIGYNGNLKTID